MPLSLSLSDYISFLLYLSLPLTIDQLLLVSEICCSIALSHKSPPGNHRSTAVDRRRQPAQPTSSPPSNHSVCFTYCFHSSWSMVSFFFFYPLVNVVNFMNLWFEFLE